MGSLSQGFNRIVAIALLFMNEEDAFWLLVYVIEHLMPPEYYSRDKQLIGAQVDQEVLKELISEKLPKLSLHLESHGVDAGLFALNWFLCVFVDNIPVRTFLHIWDSFLFEGSKVSVKKASAVLANDFGAYRKITLWMGPESWPSTDKRGRGGLNAEHLEHSLAKPLLK